MTHRTSSEALKQLLLPPRRPRVLSLFSGIGGLDIAFEALNCELIAYCEVDPYACRVMAARFPNAINLGDITEVDWKAFERDHGPIDIIIGGFPCQDLSFAGLGRGIVEGSRSGLWIYFALAIRDLRPRGVLVENVAALLSRGLDRVLGDLATCGLDAEWDCIPAAAVGAPHLRDRVFIVAYRPNDGVDGSNAQRLASERSGAAGDMAGATRGSEGEGDQRQRDGHAAGDLREARADADRDRREVQSQRQRGEVGPLDGERRNDVDGFRGPNERRPVAAHAHELGAQVPGRRRQPAVEQPRRESSAGRPWPAPAGSDWWRTEPDVGRVAHGVPQRVDRLRALGNAVVPQVAEHVAAILIDRMEAA